MKENNNQFWQRIDAIVASSKITIDRPKGTAHPKYPLFIYPLDYGFLENTTASDGQEVDIWMGSLNNKNATAILCTVDVIKNDIETKILIGCSLEEEKIILDIMNSAFMSAFIIPRPHV